MIAITAALPAIAKACLSIDNTNDGAAGVPTLANALECNAGEDDMLVRERSKLCTEKFKEVP
jgi:hypothetical protein